MKNKDTTRIKIWRGDRKFTILWKHL